MLTYIKSEYGFFNPSDNYYFMYDFLMIDFFQENQISRKIISIRDYSIIKEYNTTAGFTYYLKDKIIHAGLDGYCLELNIKDFSHVEYKTRYVAKGQFENSELVIDSEDRSKFFLRTNNLDLISLDGVMSKSYVLLQNGIIEYFKNSKINNWLRCISSETSEETWRIDFPWQISSVATFDNVIIISYKDYSNLPSDKMNDFHAAIYNIAIDGITGKEIWRIETTSHNLDIKIDKNYGVMLCMQPIEYKAPQLGGGLLNAHVMEIDIRTGKHLTDVSVTPIDWHGFKPEFVDEEGIFYTHFVYGSFGKIRKSDGILLWEFDLIDEKGDKRKVLDWLKLSNGKLVLQAPPNHKNGNLTCIFDIEENMHEASVINGIRVKDVLKSKK